MELDDEDLDAGAWGDPDLDLDLRDNGDANGDIGLDHDAEGGKHAEGGSEEGGWDMEVTNVAFQNLMRNGIVATLGCCRHG